MNKDRPPALEEFLPVPEHRQRVVQRKLVRLIRYAKKWDISVTVDDLGVARVSLPGKRIGEL